MLTFFAEFGDLSVLAAAASWSRPFDG